MADEIDSALNTATGAIVAAAVDGASKPQTGSSGTDHHIDCLNCQTPLQGDYCHACGQAAHSHRTLHGFVHDLLHGAFHFEGRIWHTLPMLAFRPGTLTRRYIEGQRIRFISPVALFLFLVFLMFAVTSFGGHDSKSENAHSLSTTETAAQSITVKDTGSRLADVTSGNAMIDAKIAKIADNPDLYSYKIKTSAYKYLWLLIPLSLPFIWLMFAWKRSVTLYDHAVFATYSLSAMMLLMITLHLAGLIGMSDDLAPAILVLIAPIHMFFQIKGAYSVSTLGALWRVVFLLFSAGIAATAFLLLLVISAAI